MPFWSQNQADSIRRTQYAGSWYENNPGKLKTELETYLSRAERADPESRSRMHISCREISGDVLALVVPHAGYMFSGATAAYAYRAAQKRTVKRVVLLGPSHHVGFRGAALPDSSKFATPLGEIELDLDLIAELKTYPFFAVHPEVHRVEHSLELQLPFIKQCFPSCKIAPIVIGQIADTSEARMIGEVLRPLIKPDDLIVVSSDFTHYGPRYGYEPFYGEAEIPEKVCKMDAKAFEFLSELDLDGFADFLQSTEDTICGMYPCQVLLSLLPPGTHGTLLKYATSRDSYAEESNNSVSYLAIAFSGASWPESPQTVPDAHELIKLTDAEKADLLKLAGKTMEIWVKEKRLPSPEEINFQMTPVMKECFGVFVTIHKGKGEQKDLRGCIGSIYPSKQLYKAVQENAVASCSRDPRFGPVIADELSSLDLELSILTPPRRVSSYNDIVVGRDGVILTKGQHQAVFLPQVAVEWNWTLEEMLSHLAVKAGLRANDWQSGAHFDTFQSVII